MNRRTFASTTALAGLFAALPPMTARAADSLGPVSAPPTGWRCLDDCAANVGQRYRVTGPASASLELVSAAAGRPGDPLQFTACFRSDSPLSEGVYLLRGRRTSMALFLQPVPGDPATVQAAFNLG